MCLLIVKTEKGKVDETSLREAFSSNSDGGGFFVADVGMKKGFFHADEMIDHYNDHSKNPMLIHFRLSTSGKTNAKNCHPFKTGSYWMGHNGVLSDYETSKKMSDTAMLAKDLDSLLKENPELLHSHAFVTILKNLIGTDKLAFMDAEGKFKIINEQNGHWNSGVWYSNHSYLPPIRTYDYKSWNAQFKTPTGLLATSPYNYNYSDECDICGYEIDYTTQDVELCAICSARYGELYYDDKNKNTENIGNNGAFGSKESEDTSVDGRYQSEITPYD